MTPNCSPFLTSEPTSGSSTYTMSPSSAYTTLTKIPTPILWATGVVRQATSFDRLLEHLREVRNANSGSLALDLRPLMAILIDHILCDCKNIKRLATYISRAQTVVYRAETLLLEAKFWENICKNCGWAPLNMGAARRSPRLLTASLASMRNAITEEPKFIP